ncbi:unnamed protein product [Lactuca virosa]|uniref:Transmembrane protein n=1 Tax=Lactuca virosa TaxID=75947 RepID=A0AAU9NJU2_9ASTR|nr:unnamed protein product [Lactuca virosa]
MTHFNGHRTTSFKTCSTFSSLLLTQTTLFNVTKTLSSPSPLSTAIVKEIFSLILTSFLISSGFLLLLRTIVLNHSKEGKPYELTTSHFFFKHLCHIDLRIEGDESREATIHHLRISTLNSSSFLLLLKVAFSRFQMSAVGTTIPSHHHTSPLDSNYIDNLISGRQTIEDFLLLSILS